MCGICGVFQFDRESQVDPADVARMNAQIQHRGPDDEGFFVLGNVGLAMRRLSIIDLQSGRQPIANEDESVWIVYNGEIYNYRDLRSQLEAKGHRFSTQSDTETIVHLYEEYGRDCVKYLQGMFAFAIWDGRRRELFLARDRLGIKPLYLRLTPRGLLFASEIKSLICSPGYVPELNQAALPEYLAFGYLSGAETLFQGIGKLMPGHTLVIGEDAQPTTAEYWDLDYPESADSLPAQYYVDTYRGLLEEAVSSHLMSDVPLGVFLSGGLDSSSVAALMTNSRSAPVKSFAVGYEEKRQSELDYARTVARYLKTDHHEVTIGQCEFFGALPRLIWHEDEPISWPSSVSLYYVAQLAREHVTVVLTGEGSDETLAGYARYALGLWNVRLDRIYRALTPGALRRFIRGKVADSRLLKADVRRRLQHTFLGRDMRDWPRWYFDDFYAAFSQTQQAGLLSDGLRSSHESAYRTALAYWEKSSGDPLARLLYTDIKSYLVELLMKQDNMSMAASIESRVPFLDHKIVEFAARIPPNLKLRGLTGKHVLKEAMRDVLPKEIIHRKKMGFPTPLVEWLRGPSLDTVEQLLLAPQSLDRGLLDDRALKQLFGEHRTLHRDHTDRIWRLLNLEHWCRIFLGGEPTSEPPAVRRSDQRERT